jgi:pilus assembly protein CpaB
VGRRTLLLIASILVAALGTALIWLYVQGADTRAQADTSLVQVWVASKAADPGGTVADVAPVPQQVPQPLAAGAVPNPGQLGSQQLVNGVTKGQILLGNMFSPQPQTGVADKNGYVAITISDPHRVPALLRAGDRVAIYAIANGSAGTAGAKKALVLVMREASVKTLGNTTQAGPNGSTVPVTIVGFEVTPEDAAKLIAIETYGQPVLELLGKEARGADPQDVQP